MPMKNTTISSLKNNILYVGFFSSRGAMADDFISIGNHLSNYSNLYILTGMVDSGIIMPEARSICQLPFNICKKSSYFRISNYKQMYKYIRQNPVDIVFFKTPNPINGVISFLLRNKPQVYYVHDYKPHSGTNKVINTILKITDRIMSKYCSCIVVASDKLKRMLKVEKPLWNKKQVEIVPLGLLDNLVFDLPECEKDIDILFFGRIEYYKGVDWFLHIVRKQFTQSRVKIIGRGTQEQLCKDLCLGYDNIEFINTYVEDMELANYISRSKIVVLPYRDATGTQVIQTAFYYKACVIATDVGSFSEIIDNGINGILIPALDEDAMCSSVNEVLSNADLRMKMGENAHEKVKKVFDNKMIALQYISLFEKVIRKENDER